MSPPAWPTRPDNAQDFDEFWLVRGLPPDPFPGDYDYGSDLARFGPPGTRWIFSTESLVNRRTLVGTSAVAKAGIERLIRKLAIKLPPVGSMGWATPLPEAPAADPVGGPMRFMRTVITGNIGQDEQVAHVIQWRTAPAPDVNQDVDDVGMFAEQVRDAWVAFLSANPGNGGAISGYFPGDLNYQDVRASYLEQTAPGAKPVYLVPTQYVPFAKDGTANGSSGASPLPYEVAMCLSLNTNLRGPRNRGRLYLGPLTANVMGTKGQFDPAVALRIGTAFGGSFVGPLNANTGCDLHVVSHKYATSVPVQGVRVGQTPDSQRRRRRGRAELYQQAWGTPIGAYQAP